MENGFYPTRAGQRLETRASRCVDACSRVDGRGARARLTERAGGASAGERAGAPRTEATTEGSCGSGERRAVWVRQGLAAREAACEGRLCEGGAASGFVQL